MSQTLAPSSPASVVGSPALVPLTAVKAWLGIQNTDTNADAMLTSLIGVASRQMLHSLDRGPVLGFQTVVETRDGTGTDNMQLRFWPVLSVTSLFINNKQILPNDDPPWGAGYRLEAWTGSDIQGRQRIFSMPWFDRPARQNVVITYNSGYFTVDNTVVSTSQNDSSNLQPVYSYITNRPWMNDQGVYDVTTQSYMAKVNYTPTASLTYQVVGGQYYFFSGDAGRPILVTYSYLPEELQQVIINFVALQFKYRDHIGVNSKTLLGKETISYERGKWDALTEAIIQPYRNVGPLL